MAINAIYDYDKWTTTFTAQQWIFRLIEEKQKANETYIHPTLHQPPPGLDPPNATDIPMQTPKTTIDDADLAVQAFNTAILKIRQAYARYRLITQSTAGPRDPMKYLPEDTRNIHTHTPEGSKKHG